MKTVLENGSRTNFLPPSSDLSLSKNYEVKTGWLHQKAKQYKKVMGDFYFFYKCTIEVVLLNYLQ